MIVQVSRNRAKFLHQLNEHKLFEHSRITLVVNTSNP